MHRAGGASANLAVQEGQNVQMSLNEVVEAGHLPNLAREVFRSIRHPNLEGPETFLWRVEQLYLLKLGELMWAIQNIGCIFLRYASLV
ncbi:predicted protein [Sclerotinia sclerotiorum 1980 UF-70]|uniref:Uncharacterized protein n=1 Tax=Sclerotinia sclerotiorum (strain ATCC 18683 / 1980 / Ss-1) TaxID=665079 RepID=A7EIK7_SCLS1|nr:predicted protein [Sclerotinia sclerotiorum 1980 UF-70]EDO02673.1 predicted protein [Sclerotinia sclerotiorum 1980 UF-70]